MKMRKILSLALACLMLLTALTGCGKKTTAAATPEAVFTSESGSYEFHGTPKGQAWITAAGSKDKIMEGSIKVREENSAITVTFNGDIMEMQETSAKVSFTYPVNGTDETFVIHRAALMKGLECTGVVLNTAKSDNPAPAPAAEPGSMFSAGGMANGLLFWNNGSVQTMILKIQSTHSYSYSVQDGLKIWSTDEQKAQYGDLWIESYDSAAGVYTIGYNLTVPIPPFAANPGTMQITDAQLQAAFAD